MKRTSERLLILAPPERKALAQIVETADLLLVGGKAWLLFPADARLLDTLAAFGIEGEDREPCLEDEEETDDDTGNDLEDVTPSSNMIAPRSAGRSFPGDARNCEELGWSQSAS